MNYIEVLKDKKQVGENVAIIGAGGIGFDVAEYLLHATHSQSIADFMAQWGVDMSFTHRAGVEQMIPASDNEQHRQVYLLQRKASKIGAGLGKTTGWIHRLGLIQKKVKMHSSCEYHKIDDQGLHLSIAGEAQILDVDHVIICAGQEPLRELTDGLKIPYQLIGGTDVAAELDAKRAIHQGTIVAIDL